MKKILLFIFVAILGVTLVACSSDSDENKSNSNDGKGTKESSKSEVSDTKFDDGNYIFEIKSTEQLTGKYDTQILAVEVTFTNNTDEPTSPWMALGIRADQETDTTVELLDGANGQYPDDYKTDLVEMGDTDIKPGATVDAIIGYEILYPGEPVILTNFDFSDEELFKRVVETTE